MITIDYCCLDASAFSFGFASSHSNTLIIEKTENALSDYVNGIIPCKINSMPVTDNGKEFFKYLKNGECISESGILDSPSLAPLASEYALNYDVILSAKIISVEEMSNGYSIMIHTNSGLENVICNEIISRPQTLSSLKFLNCIVSGCNRNTLSKICEYGVIIHDSYEKDEFIISMPFNSDLAINEARIQFVKVIKKLFGTLIKIDAFATDFVYGSDEVDIIGEFEAGATYDL